MDTVDMVIYCIAAALVVGVALAFIWDMKHPWNDEDDPM
jgi:hypothetical protein